MNSFSDSDDDGFSVVVDSSQDQSQSVIRTRSIRSRDDQEEEEHVNSSQTETETEGAVGEEDQEMDENVDASEDDDGELNNNGLSMPKRKRKDPAPVWKNCAVRLEGGKGKCNFCSKIFTCTEGSTSTLVAHIKAKHSSLDAVKELIVCTGIHKSQVPQNLVIQVGYWSHTVSEEKTTMPAYGAVYSGASS